MVDLHHPVSSESIVGRQIEGVIAPRSRDGGLVNPILIQVIEGSGIFDDFEEAAFPFLAVFAAVKESLSFSAYLSGLDAELCYFKGRPFGSESLSPGACFFHWLLVPGDALNDL